MGKCKKCQQLSDFLLFPGVTCDLSGLACENSLKIGSFNIQVFGDSKMGKPAVVEVLLKILPRYVSGFGCWTCWTRLISSVVRLLLLVISLSLFGMVSRVIVCLIDNWATLIVVRHIGTVSSCSSSLQKSLSLICRLLTPGPGADPGDPRFEWRCHCDPFGGPQCGPTGWTQVQSWAMGLGFKHIIEKGWYLYMLIWYLHSEFGMYMIYNNISYVVY